MPLRKTGAVNEGVSSFLGVPMSWSEAEGEYKDGVPQPAFPESTSIGSRCVGNLKPTPQA